MLYLIGIREGSVFEVPCISQGIIFYTYERGPVVHSPLITINSSGGWLVSCRWATIDLYESAPSRILRNDSLAFNADGWLYPTDDTDRSVRVDVTPSFIERHRSICHQLVRRRITWRTCGWIQGVTLHELEGLFVSCHVNGIKMYHITLVDLWRSNKKNKKRIISL